VRAIVDPPLAKRRQRPRTTQPARTRTLSGVSRHYGSPVGSATGTWPGDQGFQNGTADTATGLTSLGAREYDSGTASFISPDPLLDPGDPQDLNAYAYAEDTPPSGEDPSGAIRTGPAGSSCTTGTEYLKVCGGNGNPNGGSGSGSGKAGGSDGTGSYGGTGTTDAAPAANSSAADQDPGQYVLPCQDRSSYVSWLESGQFDPAIPGASASTYELDSLAVFCEMESSGHCGGYGLTDRLVKDYDNLAAITDARLDMGGLGELGQAYEAGGADDPGLGALENVTAGNDLDGLSCGGESFTPGTGILLADGRTVPIADLKPGDKVLSTNTKSGKTSPEVITAVLVHHDTDLYNLTVKTSHGTEVIHTTSSHLFWDPYLHQGWIPANQLKPGTHLKTVNGTVAVVVGGIAPKQHDGWMWDLTVPGNNDHDLYVAVGDTQVLVHNADGCGPTFTQGDVDRVTQHLSQLDHFGANDVMLQRISDAIGSGQPLTEGQTNFMLHETTEADLMDGGMPYEDAHEQALGMHPPGLNYDPDVIDQFEEFGPWWRQINGLGPRG
jgi:RHS repeat-associated protein